MPTKPTKTIKTAEDTTDETVVEPSAPVVEKTTAPVAPAAKTVYSAEDKKKIRKLISYDVELDGTETSEVLDTMLASQSMQNDEEDIPRTVIKGLPDQLPPRYEDIMVGGKTSKLAIHFVAAGQNGTFGIYNELGNRIDAAFDAAGASLLAKKCAKVNPDRRKRAHFGDL